MPRPPREGQRLGLAYLETATTLLQRARAAHPTAGLFEAADLQWWWRTPRSTDVLPQLFWFDDAARPVAAVVATEWRESVVLAPIVLPGAGAEFATHVTERGLEHARAHGLGPLKLEVDSDDAALGELLAGHGFAAEGDGLVESWLAAAARPAVSPLRDGYRLWTRPEVKTRPHHLAARSGPTVEERLRQTSLYRPDLDLVILSDDGDDAAYGLCWLDPVTATGLVEPLRTADAHQRRGLARHLLTSGIDRLARAGAKRVKICFEADNAAARDLYLGLGFEPVRRTVLFAEVHPDGRAGWTA